MTEAEKEIADAVRNADEMTLNHLADRVARRIETERLRGMVREMAMMLAIEQEVIRRDGLGRSVLLAIRRAGCRVTLADGKLLVGPKERVTADVAALVQTFRSDLIRELERE